VETEITLKNIPRRIGSHLNRHKYTYAAGAVAIGALFIIRTENKMFQSFLISKGIDPNEFYYPQGITAPVS